MKYAKYAWWGLVFSLLGTLLLFTGCHGVSVPENFQTVSVTPHRAEVSWQESPGAESYQVEIVAENGLTLPVQTTQSTSLTLDDLSADTSYTLTLTALQGDSQSDPAQLTVKTLPISVGTVTGAEAVVSEENPLEYTISWQPYQTVETNADGTAPTVSYALYESTKEDVGYQLVSGDLTETSRTLTGTKELCRRYYKVCPVLTVDGKQFTGSLCEQPALVTTGLRNDLTVSAQATSSHSILEVSWTPYDTSRLDSALENPTVSYTLYGAYTEDGEYEQLASGLTDTTWEERGLLGDMTRYYKVAVTVTAGDLSVTTAPSAQAAGATTPLSPAQQEAQQEQQQSDQPVEETTAQPSSEQSDTPQTPQESEPVSPQPPEETPSEPSEPDDTNPDSEAVKLLQAQVVAQQIAQEINANYTGRSDLDKVSAAAEMVAEYCRQGTESDSQDSATAYGVFIKGEYSSAGATRALGMVLDYLGYSWTHINADTPNHQWCELTMDGQSGWADGQSGTAGYGSIH